MFGTNKKFIHQQCLATAQWPNALSQIGYCHRCCCIKITVAQPLTSSLLHFKHIDVVDNAATSMLSEYQPRLCGKQIKIRFFFAVVTASAGNIDSNFFPKWTTHFFCTTGCNAIFITNLLLSTVRCWTRRWTVRKKATKKASPRPVVINQCQFSWCFTKAALDDDTEMHDDGIRGRRCWCDFKLCVCVFHNKKRGQ